MNRFKDSQPDESDSFEKRLFGIIRYGIKALALLMTLVIFWSIIDVVYVIYERLMTPPVMFLQANDLLKIFGSFLIVLIGVEIYENIILYMNEDTIQVKLVIATALMAIARKVIVFDFNFVSYQYIFATGFVIIGLGLSYWLLLRDERLRLEEDRNKVKKRKTKKTEPSS